MEKRILINDFATRSFRDVADQDYIAARLSYRHGLYPQFHWQSLQALEKYLKAILLYNREQAHGVRSCIATFSMIAARGNCQKLIFQEL
ncbi:MAG: HEPN domain-containing protein [Geobacteraceae bacterium]|nr:HEPN domain-containing protein [Geobacteraceae bacterium]